MVGDQLKRVSHQEPISVQHAVQFGAQRGHVERVHESPAEAVAAKSVSVSSSALPLAAMAGTVGSSARISGSTSAPQRRPGWFRNYWRYGRAISEVRGSK